MEQESAQYLMWMKRKNIMKTRIQASVMMNLKPYDSWEEKAFAQDSAGVLGGSCIWPPRSYSCSFCRREFRSAQALGGHMNIHRRDRARLKQSLSPQNEVTHDDDVLHHEETLDSNNHYPNNCSPSLIASSTLENFRVPYVCPQFSSNLEKGTKKKEIVQTGHEVYVDTDLSMGLNFVVRPNNEPIESDKEDHELISCKRHKSCKVNPSSMEELDLELRLGGDPLPKAVKL